MRFYKALTLLVQAPYFAAVLSFPLVVNAGGINGLSDGYAANNAHAQGFVKRQNEEILNTVLSSIDGIVMNISKSKSVTLAEFPAAVTTALWNNNQHYNYIVCSGKYNYNVTGTQGIDWDIRPESYTDPSTLDSNDFDVIIAGAGAFLFDQSHTYSWQYYGNVWYTTMIGSYKIIVFNAP